MTDLIALYLVGVFAVLAFFISAMLDERTRHGAGVLLFFGACLSVVWPLVAFWFLILSPWLVWRWFKGLHPRSRGEE